MHEISGLAENYKYLSKIKYVQKQIFSFSIQFLKPACFCTQNNNNNNKNFSVGNRFSHLLLKTLFLSE